MRAEERAQQTLETNLAVIGREYPEVFNDPVLTQVAALQLHNLRGHPAAGQMSELDQYRYACNQVRSRLSPASQQSTGASTRGESRSLSGDRLERKRNAPSIPGGADQRMTMQEAAPREPTTSEVIARDLQGEGASGMRTVGGYRIVQSDADAISLGYPNAASYRLAVRREIDRENEKAYAEDVAKHQARLTKKLQTPPNPTSFYVGAFPKAQQG